MAKYKCLLLIVALALLTACLAGGCQQKERRRPFGLVKLGKIDELKRPESFLSAQGLLLRYDKRGFSAMSLLCSMDLAPLQVKQQGEKQILVSPYNESSYNLDGSILSGPTKDPLPYYELVAAPGEFNGPVDTLFAKIGAEKPADWRLVVN